MLEVLGGPHDGRKIRLNPPQREVFLTLEGSASLKVKDGAERLVALGVCHNCGVRFDDAPSGVALYAPVRQVHSRRCGLCGVDTPAVAA